MMWAELVILALAAWGLVDLAARAIDHFWPVR